MARRKTDKFIITLLILPSLAFLAAGYFLAPPGRIVERESRSRDAFDRYGESIVGVTPFQAEPLQLDRLATTALWTGVVVNRHGTVLTALHPIDSPRPGARFLVFTISPSGTLLDQFPYRVHSLIEANDSAVLIPDDAHPKVSEDLQVSPGRRFAPGAALVSLTILYNRHKFPWERGANLCLIPTTIISEIKARERYAFEIPIIDGMSGGAVIDLRDDRLVGLLSSVNRQACAVGNEQIRVGNEKGQLATIPYAVSLTRFSMFTTISRATVSELSQAPGRGR